MKNAEDTLTDVYVKCVGWAMNNQQVVGEKRDYYVTLEQLEQFILAEKELSTQSQLSVSREKESVK